MSREITMKVFCLFEQSGIFENKNKKRENDSNHAVTNTAKHKRQRKFQHRADAFWARCQNLPMN